MSAIFLRHKPCIAITPAAARLLGRVQAAVDVALDQVSDASLDVPVTKDLADEDLKELVGFAEMNMVQDTKHRVRAWKPPFHQAEVPQWAADWFSQYTNADHVLRLMMWANYLDFSVFVGVGGWYPRHRLEDQDFFERPTQ